MGRMGEWALEQEDRDLELAALAQYEEELQQQKESQWQSLPGLITPPSFQLNTSPKTNSSTLGHATETTLTASWLPKKS